MKIKANDDRIKSTAAAVLLIYREAWGQAKDGPGDIAAVLHHYREDYDHFKARFPKRDLTEAKNLATLVELMPDAGKRKHYQELIEAIDRLLARIQRGKIQFSSLTELDNYFVANLR